MKNKLCRKISVALICVIPVLLMGCSTTTNISSAQNGATVIVEKAGKSSAPKTSALVNSSQTRSINTPRTEKFSSGTFLKYEFMAELAGYETLYGQLPRKFNGGNLALDILFFTPLMLVNLLELYPYYEFDLEKKVVKYKVKEADRWSIYEPTWEETDLAKYNFNKPSEDAHEKASNKSEQGYGD